MRKFDCITFFQENFITNIRFEILNKYVVDIKGWKSIGNRLDNKLRMSGFKFENLELDKNENIQDGIHEENQSNDLENLTLF